MNFPSLHKVVVIAACLLSIGSFTASAQYCLPNYAIGCTDDDDINDFKVTGVSSTSIFDTGTHCSTSAYRNMAGSMSVTMAQGGSYSAYINSDFYGEGAEVYIDFNNDGAFSASESVGGDNYIDDIGNTFTLYIPGGAGTGTHRMRVVLSYDFSYPGIDACPDSTNGYFYGEVHDYTANIITGTYCSAPASTSASGMTASSAVLMWSPVPGALGYEYILNQTSGTPSTSGTATTATSLTPTTLSSNTVYYLHLRTKCGPATYSPWVEQQLVTTASSPTCVAPAGFTLSALSSTSASLTWNAVTGTAGYEIFVSSVFLYPLTGTSLSTNGASYTGLTPNSTYYAYLRHYCSSTNVSDWVVLTFNTGRSFGSGSTSSISGNIYKNATGVPSTDSYKVWLINYNSTAGTLTAVDSAKVTGTYTFSGMAAGSYLIKAAQLNGPVGTLGQVPTYHDSSLYWGTALSAVVTTGTSLTRHIWIQQGTTTSGPGFVGGNVSLGANKGAANGVPDMLIVLRNAAGKLVKAAYTNATGDFSFSSLPAGTYSIYPEQMGYATTAFNTITVTTAQASKTGINFNQDVIKKSIKPRTTGIGAVSAGALSITLSPNPAKNTIALHQQGYTASNLMVTVTAITGQVVLTQAISGTVTTLNISALQPGIYFVRLHGAEGDAVQKLVVQP